MRILIVDDSRDDRRVLRYMVEKNGHEAIEVGDGFEGLRKAKADLPDLIISDVLMPVMDGFQFLKEIKQDSGLRSIPFMFYSSSYKESRDVRLAQSLGADIYVIKPVEPAELWNTIAALFKADRKETAPPGPLVGADAEYLKQYSQIIAAKLEEKVRELELTLEARNRAQEALRDSENRYRRITEGLTDYQYSVRVENGRAVETRQSTACATVTGYTPEEFAADPYLWIRMVAPDDRELVRERVRQILAGTDTLPLEHRILRKDGALRWICDTTILMKDAAGKLLSYDGVIKDITERKKAEQDLRASESFLSSIVENIPNMIIVKEAESLRFVRFNKAGEQLLGYSREELLGKNDYDLFPKSEADYFAAKDREVLSTNKLVDIPEENIRTKDESDRILHTQKLPIMDETGKARYLLGISEDITERKRTEEAVRKLSMAIEQSPVSIVITDVAGRIEFVNAKFTQISGYSWAEALGQNPRILKSGETSAADYQRLWKTISWGGVWRGEFHNRKKNGELYWERATIAPIRNTDDVISHYVAVKEDITEHKKLEDQLRQAQKMESIGILAGGVAHDFNNILTAIIGYGTLAQMKMPADDPHRVFLDQILASSERATHLTQSLLAFSRKQIINPKSVSLNDIVRNIEKMLRRLISEDMMVMQKPNAQFSTHGHR